MSWKHRLSSLEIRSQPSCSFGRGPEAWEAIRHLRPSRWITQAFPFAKAADAYGLVASEPSRTIQVMLEHR